MHFFHFYSRSSICFAYMFLCVNFYETSNVFEISMKILRFLMPVPVLNIFKNKFCKF
jgi:hypothetical protein